MGKREIRFFNTYEELEQDLHLYWASLTPEQRLANLHEMICRAYGLTPERLNEQAPDNTIHIVTPDENFS
jgi:hypothetical protein